MDALIQEANDAWIIPLVGVIGIVILGTLASTTGVNTGAKQGINAIVLLVGASGVTMMITIAYLVVKALSSSGRRR